MKRVGKRCKKFFVYVLSLTLAVTSSMFAVNVKASPTSHSFNTGTGMMDVNYSGYLSKHDLVFNSPITDPKQGIMVGNGRVGAQVWNANGLTMQISGVDTSEQTCFSSGLVNLYTNPGMDTGYSAIQQRLSLYDGLLTTSYDSNRTVTILGSPNSEVLGIHVEDSRGGVSSVALDLSIWDVSNVQAGDLPDLNTWRTVSTFAEPTVAGLSRGQTDANKFGYTLAATVEGASFTTQAVDSRKVRLNITPSSSYTIWIANASRLNAPGNNSVNQAKTLLNNVKSTGYNNTLNNYKNWWHNFWSKSFVQYSNASGDADYMENMYYLSTYIIAAGAYGNYPFHFINGVFSGMNDSDSNHWSNAYWYWNQRDVYNSFFASNHADMMNVFNNMYSRNFGSFKAYTSSRFGIDGIWAPETCMWNGGAGPNDYSDYTKNIMSSAAEAAQNMYLQYKYTNDAAYLSNTAYPFMKEVCKFYSAKLSYDGASGKYYMASSNSHETYWNVKNAITDLAAVRVLFPMAISASTQLGADSNLRSQWQNILNNLAAYPSDGTKYLPNDPPTAASHNNENVTCELIWPYSVTGIGAPDYSKALASFNSRPYPYGNVWSPDAIQAARLGLGDEAYSGMKRMLQTYQNYPNTRTTNTNGEFEYHGVHLSAMNESLLQSYNDKIRVFPALPNDSNFNAKFTLLAKGGFLVSSEKEANEIKYVGIKSLYGNSATVVNPWGSQQVRVRKVSDGSIITTTSNGEFTFATSANTVYVIERTSKLLSAYTAQQLTGTPNQSVKALSGTNSKLGSGSAGGSVTATTFYQDTGYGGTAKTLAAGSYTTAQLSAAGIPDNWASSIKVPAGYTVEVYDNDNFGGTKWTFTGDSSDFVAAGCNDKMSSVKILSGSGGPGGGATDTTFYQDTGYGGTAKTLAPGSYTTAQLSAAGIPDNWVSSVKVPAGYTAEVYDSDNFGGTKWTFTADNPDFVAAGCNDRMSSVKIFSGSGGGSGTKYEAENGALSGTTTIESDSSASNGKEVTHFSVTGDSVSFSGVAAGTKIVIGYCTANNPGKLSLYINGTHNQDITFPSNGVWSGAYVTVTANVSIPANATVKLQLDSGDMGANIDYILVQ